MNIAKRITTALSLLSLFVLTGCVLINKFDKMETRVNGNDVAFTLPESDFSDNSVKYMLLDIGVGFDKCTQDCAGGWEMVRPVNSNTDPIEENIVTFPIKYGVSLPNMQTRELHTLKSGNYVVSASFLIIKNGKVGGRKKVIGVFTIK